MNKQEVQNLIAEFFARFGRLLSSGMPLITAIDAGAHASARMQLRDFS